MTTATLALAAVWPSAAQSPIVVEVDPAGGELIPRFGLATEPGVLSLAAELQRSPDRLDTELVQAHAHRLPGGTVAIPAPIDAAQAGAALDVVVRHLPGLGADVDILADCGRIDSKPSEATTQLLTAADVLVLVVAPALHSLLRLKACLPGLVARCTPVVLLTGAGPYRVDEVADTLGVPVIGHLPTDAAAAAMFSGEPARWRRPHRLPLLRAATPAAAALSRMARQTPVHAVALLAEASR